MKSHSKMSSYKIRTSLLIAILLSSKFAVSASQTPLQIYELSLSNDPTLGIATAIYEASIENIKHMRGGLYPEVNLSAEYARNREDVETSGVGIAGLSYYDSNYAQLRIKQALYRKDLFSKIDIADAEGLVAKSEYKIAQQELIMRVVGAYLDVLLARDNLDFAKAEKDAIYKQLQNVKRRYDVGKSTLTDLQEARASYALSVAQFINAQDNNIDSLEGLMQLTGIQHSEISRLSPTFSPKELEKKKLKYWVDLAESNNPQLVAARHSIKALRHEIEKQSSGHYPKLDLVANYRVEETGGRFGESETDDKSIGIELVIPLYKGGQVSSKVRSANLKLNEAMLNLSKTHRAVVRETHKAFRTVKTSVNRIKALKRAVVSSETVLSMIQKGYKVGTRTSADVLDAQRGVFMAKRDYSSDKYNYILYYLQLKNLTGKLTKQDLVHISKWFK